VDQPNINDPSSIERVYPRSAYDEDVGENSRAKAEVMHGVRIVSAPAADGTFELLRASRQVAEIDVESDSIFLFPVLPGQTDAPVRQSSGYGEAHPDPDASRPDRSRNAGYEDFVTRVLRAAENARFKPPVGRHDERLEGFRGG
jgi:hypothetical protein